MSDFANTLYRVANTPMVYESSDLLDEALSVMPLERLYQRAEEREAEDGSWGLQDYLIMGLLEWFKNDFFTWVNSPKCDSCGNETDGVGRVKPMNEEARDGAGVTELYKCRSCKSITRFPRYGSPRVLLKFRKGRCGEWADCFTLLCRALGSKVRYVWNSEDHVWTEVYSEKQERWIHADSCENAWDKPLLYGEGWGKKMAYVIGFSVEGAVDITRRYVRDKSKALPRDKASESDLNDILFRISSARRINMNPQEIMVLEEQDTIEQAELASYFDEPPPTPSQTTDLHPRESGKGEWTRSRGEDGSK